MDSIEWAFSGFGGALIILFIGWIYKSRKGESKSYAKTSGLTSGNAKIEDSGNSNNTNEQTINLTINSGHEINHSEPSVTSAGKINREDQIELLKGKLRILFIDDKKTVIAQNLRNDGWKNTKLIHDVKSLNIAAIKNADVFFVDINGVGISLGLEHEGLDLALMIKKKFKNKKVVIYSGNKKNNMFHEAWDVCDHRLEKNALPIQFESLVEQFALEIYK